MRFLLTTTAAFVAVILTGGIWIGLVQRLAGEPPGVTEAAMGGIFTVAFMWLLLQRLRRLLAHPERRSREMLLLAFNFALLVFAYAWVHHRVGLLDMSGPVPRPTESLGDALYFSIVTTTTLGYGDFIPIGPGRTIAAMQALTGYFILGILVSTGFQLLAPNLSPGVTPEEQREAEEQAKEDTGEVEEGEET